LQLGLLDEFRYRWTVDSKTAGTLETDMRPRLTTSFKLSDEVTFTGSYNPRWVVLIDGEPAQKDNANSFSHRGNTSLAWKPSKEFSLTLAEVLEYGTKNFQVPVASTDDPLDDRPVSDTVKSLDTTTSLNIRWKASDEHTAEAQGSFSRQGGFGSTTTQLDPRNLVPELVSPRGLLRDTWAFNSTDAVIFTAQGSMQSFNYGSGPDSAGNIINYGGPSDSIIAVDIGYGTRAIPASEVGASLGYATYRTPDRGFETDPDQANVPNVSVGMPVGGVWLRNHLLEGDHGLEFSIDGNVGPHVDRIAGDINPRLRTHAGFKYKSVVGPYARIDGDHALDLDDGTEGRAFFGTGSTAINGKAGVGFTFKGYGSAEIGAMYSSNLRQQLGEPTGSATERWTAYLQLNVFWDVVPPERTRGRGRPGREGDDDGGEGRPDRDRDRDRRDRPDRDREGDDGPSRDRPNGDGERPDNKRPDDGFDPDSKLDRESPLERTSSRSNGARSDADPQPYRDSTTRLGDPTPVREFRLQREPTPEIAPPPPAPKPKPKPKRGATARPRR
jgi:hypothetical protein